MNQPVSQWIVLKINSLLTKHFSIPADGKVIKFHTSSASPVVVSESQVFSLRTPVREIVVSRKTQTLIVFSDHKIVSVPIQRCSEFTCKKCVQRQDPYCAWDVTKHECVAVHLQEKKGVFYQDLKGGGGGASLCKNEKQSLFHGVAPKNLQDRNYTELEVEQEILPTLNDSHRRIVLSSISSSDLEQTLEHHEAHELQTTKTPDKMVNEARLNWIFICFAFCIIFAFGLCIGYYLSVKNCQKFPLALDNRNDFNMWVFLHYFEMENYNIDLKIAGNPPVFITTTCWRNRTLTCSPTRRN